MTKNPKLGYYCIGGKTFWNKATALIEGSKMGLTYDDLEWNFNDNRFKKHDWSQEPEGDIRSYYHIRARQLRDKYDYLILNFSGGSDSTTILYSFIQQGLFLDEVVVRHATAGTNKWTPNNLNYNAANEFSEFEYAAKPILKWLEKVSPRTKITVHDFSKDIIDDKLVWDENFIYWTGDYVTPGCIARFNHATNLDHLKIFDKGKSVGIIFGTDKPRVIYQNDDVNIVFVDRATHTAIPATVTSGFDNTQVELFYWSPDLPELMIKQCHIIKKWFEMPQNERLSYMLNFWWQLSPINRGTYESTIKGLIYPDYDLTTFQTDKPVKATMQEWDYWIEDFKDSSGFYTFKRGLNHLYTHIDKSFLKVIEPLRLPGVEINSENWEYRPCYSKRYYLGKFKKNHS